MSALHQQGLWSSAYTFRRGGTEYIARFSATRESFEKDALAARRATPELPIPRIIEIGAALGGYYAVSERAKGPDLDALSGAELRRVLPALLRVLDGRSDLSGTTGYGSWGADGSGAYATWQEALGGVDEGTSTYMDEWRARLAPTPTAAAAFDVALARLRELLPYCPEERHLVHSDLLHHNVPIADDRISAVLDWGSSIYGDFVYDIAWFTFWAPWYPAWWDINFVAEAVRHYATLGVAVEHFEERLRCYELYIGLENQAFSARRRNWAKVDAVGRRLLELARAS